MSGAMVLEEDAEVYSWRLLQEDKERELMGDRTHSTGDHVQEPHATYSSRDAVQAYNSKGHRPLSGYIRFAKYSQYE